jgi:uncharacterized protein YkwD
MSDPASALLTLTNRLRGNAGAAPLQWHAQLAQVAQQHADTMAREGWFDHVDTQGRAVGERLMDAGFVYRFAGENISAGKATAQETFDWWLQSAPHRDNMLKAEFTDIGFGYCFMQTDRNHFHHYWVMVLAAPMHNGGH